MEKSQRFTSKWKWGRNVTLISNYKIGRIGNKNVKAPKENTSQHQREREQKRKVWCIPLQNTQKYLSLSWEKFWTSSVCGWLSTGVSCCRVGSRRGLLRSARVHSIHGQREIKLGLRDVLRRLGNYQTTQCHHRTGATSSAQIRFIWFLFCLNRTLLCQTLWPCF